MEILVCVKRVPDPGENEIAPAAGGQDIRRDDLVYGVNEWDNYAVEEALRIVEREGGSVTVVSAGAREDAEEVVRREMAMGAEKGLCLTDPAFQGADGEGVAALLAAAVKKGAYDLVLTGAQADDGAAQVGGMLAAMLDWPFASLVNRIEGGGPTLVVGREIEGGAQEVSEIETPCVLSVQTGINEPRYVGIRGIRKVASLELPVLDAAGLGVQVPAARVRRLDYFVPPATAGAEMLEGSVEDVASRLAQILKAKGGIK